MLRRFHTVSDPIENWQTQIENALNDIANDQTVFRMTLQCFLLNMTLMSGRPILQDLKKQVLGSIGQTLHVQEGPQDGGHRKNQTTMRAELFFLEMEEALGSAGAPSRRRGAN
jgi:hypothetical protein